MDKVKRTGSSDDAVSLKTIPLEYAQIRRRRSIDEGPASYSPSFLLHMQRTKEMILAQEDTDRNAQVTIEDAGPKYVKLSSALSGGLSYRSIRGHYMISNLLQEIALASDPTQDDSTRRADGHLVIEERVLNENPVYRLCKMVTSVFWPSLKRSMDLPGLRAICRDEKNRSGDFRPRIYVPNTNLFAKAYYQKVAPLLKPEFDLDVQVLPEIIDAEFVESLNEHPGLLSLQLRIQDEYGFWRDAEEGVFSASEPLPDDIVQRVAGAPFVVPGGRFNEMYGWDSYFSVLGLLHSLPSLLPGPSQFELLYLAKSMCDNLRYEIEHYGKILNANRSYYLLRSQPPLFTDMAWQIYRVYEELIANAAAELMESPKYSGLLLMESPRQWLRKMLLAAMKEYFGVWRAEPRYLPHLDGLSRYFGEGKGMPPETESSHYNAVLRRFARDRGYSCVDDPAQIAADYQSGFFECPELDEYLIHDRAMRESGHDTTYRLDGRCAHVATVDLNSLLHKYEVDVARMLEEVAGVEGDEGFGGDVSFVPECFQDAVWTPDWWLGEAEKRKRAMDRWLWNEEASCYYDWDFVRGESVVYESATALWPIWAGAASNEQRDRLLTTLLPQLEMPGGLVAGSLASRGSVSLDRPPRQWDYPFGWAPHQILFWLGLKDSHPALVARIAYRWLWTAVYAYTNYHGVVPEKFDVARRTHRLTGPVEYGNVGTCFGMLAREGFGWMNASLLVGLSVLGRRERKALGALIEPEQLFACE